MVPILHALLLAAGLMLAGRTSPLPAQEADVGTHEEEHHDPQVLADLVDGHWTLVYGMSFGIGF